MTVPFIIVLIVAVIVAVFAFKGFLVVRQSDAVVIERLGSFNRVLGPGVNWIIPFVDSPRALKMKRVIVRGGESVPVMVEETRIDLRETVFDFPSQPVITTDNVSVQINGALYFQIIDPRRAVYEVENLVQAVEVLAKTSLRSEVGKMELDKLFESRQEINDRLQLVMDEAGDKWGVKVNRVEIQDITIPDEVEAAMRKQMVAERERRAVVKAADGQREAEIAIAQGTRESAILRAEGEKQAAILRAEGEREAIHQLLSVAGDRLAPQHVLAYLLGLEYLQTLPDMAKNGDRVFIPYEASALLGAVGAVQDVAQLGEVMKGIPLGARS